MKRKCEQCGNDFHASGSQVGRFCSRDCMGLCARSKETHGKTGEKKCAVCKQIKPAAEFHLVATRGREYLQGRCRTCNSDYMKAWSRTPSGRESKRAHARLVNLRRFGLTEEIYGDLLSSQHGGCAICGNVTTDSTGRKNLSIDHDHDTGEVRGLLCHSCNVAVGLFRDNVELLERAVQYLSRERRSLKLVASGE